MLKRHLLKTKVVKSKKRKRFDIKKAECYYSGFCLTDNLNFALFDISEQNIIDIGIKDVLPFAMSEDDLQMIINRTEQVRVSRGIISVTIDGYGLVDRNVFNLFQSTDKSIFHPVTEWFGNPCNRLITIVNDEGAKPIGVFKTIIDEKEN